MCIVNGQKLRAITDRTNFNVSKTNGSNSPLTWLQNRVVRATDFY